MNTTQVKQKNYSGFADYINGKGYSGQGLQYGSYVPSLTGSGERKNPFLEKNTSSYMTDTADDELSRAKRIIKETVSNSLGSGKLLGNLDKVTDDALLRGKETAKKTIDNNIRTGRLPQNAKEIYPYLTGGMTYFYAAGELGLNDVADYSRKVAYFKSPKNKVDEKAVLEYEDYLKNQTRATSKDSEHNPDEWYESAMKATVYNKEVVKNTNTSKGKSFLDGLSDFLSVASLIPGIDTFINIAQIPVDLARGDYMGALLDIAGAIPVIGELADTAKLARTADNIVDLSKATKAIDKMYDVAKASDKYAKAIEEAGYWAPCVADGFTTAMVYESTDRPFGAGFINGFASTFGEKAVEKILKTSKNGKKKTVISIFANSMGAAMGSLAENGIYYRETDLQKLAKDAASSAVKGVIEECGTLYLEEMISIANEAGSAARILMKYDEKFGKALEKFLKESIKILSAL